MNKFETMVEQHRDLMRRAAADCMTPAEMSEAIHMLCGQLAATTCPGHGRSECVSCCWPKGDGYREGKANPELQLHHVALALESVRGGPVLTSNQCYDLARALNGIQRDRVKS